MPEAAKRTMYKPDPRITQRLKEVVFSGLPSLFDTSLQLTGVSVCLYGTKHAPNGSPALDLPGKVVAGSRAGELDRLTVQGGIPEEVTEVLKQLQQLIGRILEYSNNLCGHHVVHDEERRLGREAEVTQKRTGQEAVLPSPRITPQTLSKFLCSARESHILTLIHSAIQMPQQVPNYPPLNCDYI